MLQLQNKSPVVNIISAELLTVNKLLQLEIPGVVL